MLIDLEGKCFSRLYCAYFLSFRSPISKTTFRPLFQEETTWF